MVDSSKNSFSRIIKNFDPKDEKQALELKKILNSYPYFQSVSAHLLKSLKIQEKESFNELLPKTALISYDRRILRDWLFTSEEINTPDTSKIEESCLQRMWVYILQQKISKSSCKGSTSSNKR